MKEKSPVLTLREKRLGDHPPRVGASLSTKEEPCHPGPQRETLAPKTRKKAEDMAQLVEFLPYIHKSLGLI